MVFCANKYRSAVIYKPRCVRRKARAGHPRKGCRPIGSGNEIEAQWSEDFHIIENFFCASEGVPVLESVPLPAIVVDRLAAEIDNSDEDMQQKYPNLRPNPDVDN